jgi:ABC-type antimicrobial peptide transport system permease subunit
MYDLWFATTTFRSRLTEFALMVVAVALTVAATSVAFALTTSSDRLLTQLEQSTGSRQLDLNAYQGSGGARALQGDRILPLMEVQPRLHQTQFQLSDLEVVKRDVPDVRYAYVTFPKAAFRDFSKQSIKNLAPVIVLRAVTFDFIAAANLRVFAGSWFTLRDQTEKNRVIVLTRAFARQRFGNDQPIGEKVELEGVNYRVIGVFDPPISEPGFSKLERPNLEDGVIPFTATPQIWQANLMIFSVLLAPGNQAEARSRLRTYVERRWHGAVRLEEPDRSQSVLLRALRDGMSLAVWLAALAVLVGGVNLVNLQLADRTRASRRVALQRSLGASRNRIFAGAMLEGLCVGAVGVILGLLASMLMAAALSRVFAQGPSLMRGLSVQLSPTSLASSAALSLFVIILCSSYPAWLQLRHQRRITAG